MASQRRRCRTQLPWRPHPPPTRPRLWTARKQGPWAMVTLRLRPRPQPGPPIGRRRASPLRALPPAAPPRPKAPRQAPSSPGSSRLTALPARPCPPPTARSAGVPNRSSLRRPARGLTRLPAEGSACACTAMPTRRPRKCPFPLHASHRRRERPRGARATRPSWDELQPGPPLRPLSTSPRGLLPKQRCQRVHAALCRKAGPFRRHRGRVSRQA
mmetsp:Transcript_24671/g.93289  ORF Transcript_24671/g.93289 Transcript_24671/m.93289 type:complete len:214 (-) Transcript_24671:289-930(-)